MNPAQIRPGSVCRENCVKASPMMLRPGILRHVPMAAHNLIARRGMAGHSHWSTIKRMKGAVDAQRYSSLFLQTSRWCTSPCPDRQDVCLNSTDDTFFRAALYAKMAKQLRSALDHGGGKYVSVVPYIFVGHTILMAWHDTWAGLFGVPKCFGIQFCVFVFSSQKLLWSFPCIWGMHSFGTFSCDWHTLCCLRQYTHEFTLAACHSALQRCQNAQGRLNKSIRGVHGQLYENSVKTNWFLARILTSAEAPVMLISRTLLSEPFKRVYRPSREALCDMRYLQACANVVLICKAEKVKHICMDMSMHDGICNLYEPSNAYMVKMWVYNWNEGTACPDHSIPLRY